MEKLYTTYVRPHLESGVAAWSPYTKEDKCTLQKVQRHARRCIKRLEGLSYEERLFNLRHTILERRRERDDIIQMYKIQYQKDQIFSFAELTTRESRIGNRSQ